MPGAETSTLSRRDQAVLRAVAEGRCELGTGWAPLLLVDGLVCTDFAAGRRLVAAGLVHAPDPARPLGPARLTAAGRAALAG
ncbi:hypothetical protein [Pseudonocardia kunmingensis]|uniref:Winged helix DNA-binding protein n=1 Tax=Pseudonocardia kunmingensis TaxID=630975 RepID=A0A543E2L0_9PSEU|nr:hypothetical protein [Pseudonocardia kunmingensis]TQM15834.1 hypothetical protein FB558_2628 [Pseudonocardia kunmingensis]